MKKKSLILLSILFSLFIFEKTFSKAFYIGQIIRGEIEKEGNKTTKRTIGYSRCSKKCPTRPLNASTVRSK